jgi:hypothetical protein
LLKETITPRGTSLLQGRNEIISSLKVFGKFSVSESSPAQIKITAYVVC